MKNERILAYTCAKKLSEKDLEHVNAAKADIATSLTGTGDSIQTFDVHFDF